MIHTHHWTVSSSDHYKQREGELPHAKDRYISVYMYIYIYTCIDIYICIHIYIYNMHASQDIIIIQSTASSSSAPCSTQGSYKHPPGIKSHNRYDHDS